jgi:hypothetical protein
VHISLHIESKQPSVIICISEPIADFVKNIKHLAIKVITIQSLTSKGIIVAEVKVIAPENSPINRKGRQDDQEVHSRKYFQ